MNINVIKADSIGHDLCRITADTSAEIYYRNVRLYHSAERAALSSSTILGSEGRVALTRINLPSRPMRKKRGMPLACIAFMN